MTCDPVPIHCPLRSASVVEALLAMADEGYRLLGNRESNGDTCARGRELLARYERCFACWGTPDAERFRREQPAPTRLAVTRSPVARKQLSEIAI